MGRDGRWHILTGWIRASSEGGSSNDLTPPFGSTAGVGGTFDLDLLQSFATRRFHLRTARTERNLTDLEGGLDGLRTEDTEMGFEYVRVLDEYGGSRLYQGV